MPVKKQKWPRKAVCWPIQRKELWQCVSSHAARRNFATNLYLDGYPTLEIMKITGHKTEKAFMRYIRVSKLDAAKKLSAHMKKRWSKKLLKVAWWYLITETNSRVTEIFCQSLYFVIIFNSCVISSCQSLLISFFSPTSSLVHYCLSEALISPTGLRACLVCAVFLFCGVFIRIPAGLPNPVKSAWHQLHKIW